MLAHYTLRPLYGHVQLIICPSVTRQYRMETAEHVELVFGKEASRALSYTVL